MNYPWIIQGGQKNPTGSTGLVTNLPKTMKDRNYVCIISPSGSDNDTGGWSDLQGAICGGESTYTYGKSETSFRISCTSTIGLNWIVLGYAM